MTQPPQPPQPSTARDPQDPQHGAAGSGAHPAAPQPAESPATSGRGKGPLLAIVGCSLLVVVLLLALGGFFGVRALMADDGDSGPGEQPTASQEESPAGLPQDEALVEGQGAQTV